MRTAFSCANRPVTASRCIRSSPRLSLVLACKATRRSAVLESCLWHGTDGLAPSVPLKEGLLYVRVSKLHLPWKGLKRKTHESGSHSLPEL